MSEEIKKEIKMEKPDDLLGNDNYFHWKFNVKMTLAWKGILENILETKPGAAATADWKVKDTKAYAIIVLSDGSKAPVHHSSCTTFEEVWDTLRDYYNKCNLQKRFALTHRLHEFLMKEGSSKASHLGRFDAAWRRFWLRNGRRSSDDIRLGSLLVECKM
ncbi:hypothetical protein PsorP6_012643 [Peronosclerospora sorghi]|uniref:Uncharacterized protein n=1 Tax=Peronosclerospora sorghi TaxID=230839 RepID=A0ACC0WIG8_9STRA|nr:hypothetical protein PsorP6_012643 [Peronosclerospora sorghi]